jgi:F-type H+-transporting ATPase subunit delta
MRQYKVANRYAKALFTLAVETNQLEEVNKDIELIRAVEHEEFRRIILSPIINGDKKVALFDAVFGGRISKLTQSFFNLVFQKGRMTSLIEIRDDFALQYREYKGIKIMKLTTAVPVSDETKENIRKRILDIERYKNSTLILEEKVDPSLVGGFVIQIDDELFNASIKNDLEFIKNQFVENMYIQKIR